MTPPAQAALRRVVAQTLACVLAHEDPLVLVFLGRALDGSDPLAEAFLDAWNEAAFARFRRGECAEDEPTAITGAHAFVFGGDAPTPGFVRTMCERAVAVALTRHDARSPQAAREEAARRVRSWEAAS